MRFIKDHRSVAGPRKAQTERGGPLLHKAAEEDLKDVVEILCQSGASVNEPGPYKETALHWACARRSKEIVQTLLLHGADANLKDEDDETPLLIAVDQSEIYIVRILLDRGAEVDIRNRNGMTPLHVATGNGNAEVAQTLLEYGANVDAKYNAWKTPLHLAIGRNDTEMVRLLLEMGADPKIASEPNETPESMATTIADPSIIHLLENRPPLKQRKLGRRQPQVTFSKPQPDNDRKAICANFQVRLWSPEMEDEPTVWDLMHGDSTKIDSASKRWIHLPYNNVRPQCDHTIPNVTMMLITPSSRYGFR